MNDFIPTDSAKVTIGVCGEQAAGKTVFLACIFQSIWTAFPDDVILDFDRDDIGNADYFRDIEDRLIENGHPEGTLPHSVVPARIFVKPYQPLPRSMPPVLSVDIQDFAGRHFRSLANLKGLDAGDSDSEDVKTLRKVNEILKKADAFVILINCKEIDPLNETPQRNPFSPSVNFLLTHCRTERKPVALLFTQSDQTPLLTEEAFRTMPRVQAFERQFTADLDEAAAAGMRPFGIVQRIACYETVPGDLAPVRQTLDGNIWRPEPAKVILDLLRAAMPRINARLMAAADEARRKEEGAVLVAERARRFRRAVTAAAAIALLLGMGAAFFTWHARQENAKVQTLADIATAMTSGRLASLSSEKEAILGEILNGYRNDRDGASPEVREAISNVHKAFSDTGRQLVDRPALDSAYSDEVVRFQRLATLLDPEQTAEWRSTFMPLLEARTEFLSKWLNDTANLDDAIRQFSAGDAIFAQLLTTQSGNSRPPRVSSSQFRSAPMKSIAA